MPKEFVSETPSEAEKNKNNLAAEEEMWPKQRALSNLREASIKKLYQMYEDLNSAEKNILANDSPTYLDFVEILDQTRYPEAKVIRSMIRGVVCGYQIMVEQIQKPAIKQNQTWKSTSQKSTTWNGTIHRVGEYRNYLNDNRHVKINLTSDECEEMWFILSNIARLQTAERDLESSTDRQLKEDEANKIIEKEMLAGNPQYSKELQSKEKQWEALAVNPKRTPEEQRKLEKDQLRKEGEWKDQADTMRNSRLNEFRDLLKDATQNKQ